MLGRRPLYIHYVAGNHLIPCACWAGDHIYSLKVEGNHLSASHEVSNTLVNYMYWSLSTSNIILDMCIFRKSYIIRLWSNRYRIWRHRYHQNISFWPNMENRWWVHYYQNELFTKVVHKWIFSFTFILILMLELTFCIALKEFLICLEDYPTHKC